jgi:hypothetical protein
MVDDGELAADGPAAANHQDDGDDDEPTSGRMRDQQPVEDEHGARLPQRLLRRSS